jgi:cell division protein FtsN
MFQERNFGFSLISNAYAERPNKLIGTHNTPSTARKVWYGISGNITNGWFVMVGSHKQKTEADGEAQELRNMGYDARVFPPFEDINNYSVAIGSYLTLKEANALRKKAIKAGLPESIDLWKWK